MKRSNILAHRGLWTHSEEKNRLGALISALEFGFGVETDVRDLNGTLVVAHDPPRQNNSMLYLSDLLEAAAPTINTQRLALNIKADGLAGMVKEIVEQWFGANTVNCFVFDMSVPDSLNYLHSDLDCYSRASEYEHEPCNLDRALGVWVDNFTGDYDQINACEKFLALGKRVTCVSPELHGREHWPVWEDLILSGVSSADGFELCTDFPMEAYEYFGGLCD